MTDAEKQSQSNLENCMEWARLARISALEEIAAKAARMTSIEDLEDYVQVQIENTKSGSWKPQQ